MRFFSRVGVALVAMLALGAVPAAAKPAVKDAKAAARPAAITPETFKVERTVLDNGLVLLTHEDHSVPTVTFWQWFKVGSRNERPGITGISHFFEHMMFDGSKNVGPKEYDTFLEANGGYSNAFTDKDMTAYYEDAASDRLGVLLFLDSDRMRDLSLRPDLFENQRGVIMEERRVSAENSIPGMLEETLDATAFMASSYHWPVLGWMEDLRTLRREDMVEYFDRYYAPNNCVLVLTGDFDTKAAVDSIKAYFGDIPRRADPRPPVDSEPPQRGERRAEVHYPAQNVTIDLGYKAPNLQSKDLQALQVLSRILSDGESSRLHRALVYDKQIALQASTQFQPQIDRTLFGFYVTMKPGRTGAEGEAAIYEVLDKLAAEGPTARELEKAKNLLEAQFVTSFELNNGAGQQLAFHEHLFGDYRAMYGTLDRIRAVTAEDCRRVAKELFVPRARTVVTLVPETPADAGAGE